MTTAAGLSALLVDANASGSEHRLSQTMQGSPSASSSRDNDDQRAQASGKSRLSKAKRWNYVERPVRVSGGSPWVENVLPSDPVLILKGNVGSAFDGYGAQGVKPGAIRGWQEVTLPTPQAPHVCEIDYGTPVAVTAFVHYFYVPGSRDLRFLSPAPSAFRRVRIKSRNSESSAWRDVANLEALASACPQVLPVEATEPAQYWRLEILELAPGADMLMSYEIETYTGGVPEIIPFEQDSPNFPSIFAKRMGAHQPSIGPVRGALATLESNHALGFSLEHAGRTAHGEFQLLVGNQPVNLIAGAKGNWRADLQARSIFISSCATPMGVLLKLTCNAKPDEPVKYQRVKLRISVSKVGGYYIPAYAWHKEPVDLTVNSANVQTRLATLETGDMTVCLVPGTDRGNLGLTSGAAFNELLLGSSPTPVLLAGVRGNWWDAYRFAVRDIYEFREQTQTVPVSEIQYGISRYMIMNDGVWEPTLGTVRSWPDRDPHYYYVYKGFDAFALYGTPYSLPTYWARYVMNGDNLARERCRSIVHWLCRSGVRMQRGPARGAFFCLQRFYNGEKPSFNKMGVTQANTSILTSQSTGGALWSLLYYRTVSGEQNAELNEVIDEAAAWLLKTQMADGGWPYGHDIHAKPLLDRVEMGNKRSVKALPSSGAIWNIWSLWRLGKQTGEGRYLEAAQRGKEWFAKEFVVKHHYHGYWEDVGPGSREGYDAAIAAVAFGEMGDKRLAVETARDAVQWVFTRQIECRTWNNSAGLVSEQTGWSPASYCNPMMALAAWTAWQITNDNFWQPFAMIPKALGWWYQPDLGAMVWIVDSTRLAPIVGPAFESWWNDWCIAQVGALTLRWLIREINRRSNGQADINEDTLAGTFLGRRVRVWAPRGGLRPFVPPHNQVNWLCFRSAGWLLAALINHGTAGEAGIQLNSRNINGVKGAQVRATAVHTFLGSRVASDKWNGENLVHIPSQGMIVFEWKYKQ